ncbi:MAG: hypothetical protein JNL42_08120 [Anaerolineae bacterium]|nr:hypothetical protein [Anaerolineae bacterium]
MVTYKYQYKDRQMPAAILVAPASKHHAADMQQLAGLAYAVQPEEIEAWFDQDQFRSRIEKFPEGQWIAVEATSGRVVGVTSGMRFDFDPHAPLLESWETTTGYG